MKKLKKTALLILSIPAITMLIACEEARAPEVTGDTFLTQEIEDPTESTQEEEKAKEDIREEAEEHAAEEVEEEAEQEALDKSIVEEMQLQIMREDLGSFVDIKFNSADKIYTMTPTDQSLIDEIAMLSVGIGHESWGVLVDGVTAMSESLENALGKGYSITIVNPLNHENVLLWIYDGVVIYNVIDEL